MPAPLGWASQNAPVGQLRSELQHCCPMAHRWGQTPPQWSSGFAAVAVEQSDVQMHSLPQSAETEPHVAGSLDGQTPVVTQTAAASEPKSWPRPGLQVSPAGQVLAEFAGSQTSSTHAQFGPQGLLGWPHSSGVTPSWHWVGQQTLLRRAPLKQPPLLVPQARPGAQSVSAVQAWAVWQPPEQSPVVNA